MYERRESGTHGFPIKHALEAMDISKPDIIGDVDSTLYWMDTAEGHEVWSDISHGRGYERFDAYWEQHGGLKL